MKRNLIFISALTLALGVLIVTPAVGSDKAGPVTGTWDCQAKGGSSGDMAFTLYLTQNGEEVEGSVSSPLGDAPITSATFKGDKLEIHIDTEEGNYLLVAKVDKGALSGTWSKDENDKGTWTGKQTASK